MSVGGENVVRALRSGAAIAGLLCGLLLANARSARAAHASQDQVTRDFQKTVTLGGGQSVYVEHKFGEVRVHGESGRDVKIQATIRAQANSHEEAESFAQKIQIEVTQSSDGVRVKTIYPEGEHRWFQFSRHSSWSVGYDIGMPSDAPLTVRNSFGSINVVRIHATTDLENSHGSLTAQEVGAARLNNSFGSIQLSNVSGNATVNDTNANVEVTDVKGTLDVRDRFGGITARNIQGAVTINNGNGTVTLAEAASANIVTSFGGVDVRNVHGALIVHDNNGGVDVATIGGAAEITNSFGTVTITDLQGELTCRTNNGRVKGSNLRGNAVTIRDSFANIELENINGALDAETSNGKVIVRDARGSVTLKSSFGAIEATNIPKGIRATTGNAGITLTDIGGDAFAKASFGTVLVERVNGNLMVEDNNGSVTARSIKGDARVTTSFSGVTLESISGRISVDNQNGGISVTAVRPSSGCRDISLKTSFSSIHVRIPDGVGYNLTAHTSFGRITSELPITSTGSIGGDNLSGTIGSGGCQLQLNNSNGSIEIAKAP